MTTTADMPSHYLRTADNRFMRHAQLRLRTWAYICLLATIFNALAVQTHVHFDQQPDSPTTLAMDGATDADVCAAPCGTTDQDHCALCQALAQAGAYLFPSSISLTNALSAVALINPPALIEIPSSLPSYYWRSRAPPF